MARTAGFLAWVEEFIPSTQVSEARSFFLSQLQAYLDAGGPAAATRIVLPTSSEAEERVVDVVKASSEMAFAKVWARTVLTLAMSTIRAEYEAAGKADLFPHLRNFLAYQLGDEDLYAKAAPKAGISASALRLAVYHFRQRYRDVLRATVMDTLVTNERTDEELTALLCAAT
jgi:hypothetical protein